MNLFVLDSESGTVVMTGMLKRVVEELRRFGGSSDL